jgi:hypothetical protein
MNEAEKRALEEAAKKAKETITPIIEQRALPDKIPPRQDLK